MKLGNILPRYGFAILMCGYASAAAAKIVEPSLVSGKVVTKVVNVLKAPGLPIIELKINPGTVGYSNIQINVTSPSGSSGFVAMAQSPQYPPLSRDPLTILLQSTFFSTGLNLYSAPGVWNISSITIQFNDGNSFTYSGSELQSVFPDASFMVRNNGTPDVTPPTFGNGKILTPTISLSSAQPYFAAKLKVADDVSGVENIYLEFTVQNQFVPGAYEGLSAPLLQGVSEPSLLFQSSSPIGTYTISGISVCDYANNCVNDNSPADIQKAFGATTFQVTP